MKENSTHPKFELRSLKAGRVNQRIEKLLPSPSRTRDYKETKRREEPLISVSHLHKHFIFGLSKRVSFSIIVKQCKIIIDNI